jgi:hypothetical protein
VSEPSNDPNTSNGPSMDALQAELEANRQRIAALEAENAALVAAASTRAKAAPPGARRTHHVWVAILLVVGMLLTPVSILALFLNSQISDTGRYVQNVKPLSSDPAIQSYVADDITKELFARVDIGSYVKDALPDRAQVLAAPLTTALQSFVREATVRIIQTDQFQKLWVEANRVAHAQLVNVLTGKETAGITATRDGAVQIDLSSVAKLVSDQLQSTGIDLFSRIPATTVGGKITLFQSNDLYKVRQAVGVLNTLAYVLPLVVFGAFGGAIYLSRSRRRGFVLAAIAFTFGAFLLALFLFVARGLYLDAATSNHLPYDAAAAAYDTLVRFLHTAVRAVLTFSIIVLITVLFAGPSRLATWFRSRVAWAADWLGSESNRAGWDWLAPKRYVVGHKRTLRIVTAALAFLWLLLTITRHRSPSSRSESSRSSPSRPSSSSAAKPQLRRCRPRRRRHRPPARHDRYIGTR